MCSRIDPALAAVVYLLSSTDYHCLLLVFLVSENDGKRLTLASLDLPKTPAASGLARSARETFGGGHSWLIWPTKLRLLNHPTVTEQAALRSLVNWELTAPV
ncbi:hypothetical protein TYRP_019375 [Tyrophagus putrescentiae]|nr:hypothetical protein TYRP_019375 [Tyrophagus putrescentiae]